MNICHDFRFGKIMYNVLDLYVGKSFKLYGEYSPGESALFADILQPGDVVVILSDGVTETAPWRKIEDCLSLPITPQEKAQRIIALVEASKREDKDNASVILYDLHDPAAKPAGKKQGNKKKGSMNLEKIKQRLSDRLCV